MTRQQLQVEKRETGTAQSKSMRRSGVLPANVYGYGLEGSIPVSVSMKELNSVLKETGETDLLDLVIEGESGSHPVLMYEIQEHPVTDEIIHVDFYKVNMDEEVDIEVPLEFTGESPAVSIHSGILITLLSELPISALPANIPHDIEVDLTRLVEIGDQLTVADIEIPENVTLKIDSPEDELIVRIDAPKTAEELEEELSGDDEPEVESEDGETEGEEGAEDGEEAEEPTEE